MLIAILVIGILNLVIWGLIAILVLWSVKTEKINKDKVLKETESYILGNELARRKNDAEFIKNQSKQE